MNIGNINTLLRPREAVSATVDRSVFSQWNPHQTELLGIPWPTLPRPREAVSATVDRSVFSLAASRKVTTARAWSSDLHLATWCCVRVHN